MMRRLPAWLSLVVVAALPVACSSGDPRTSGAKTSDTSSSSSSGGGESGGQGGSEGPKPTEEDAGGFKADDAWIFSDQTIHSIEITLTSASIAALDADAFTFVTGDFTFDGSTVPGVGVRLRGKIGSFRPLSGKPKFKISFDHFVPNQRFFGLEAMSLNNEVVDCSYLKEPLAYRIFSLAGVPTERTGFAKVTVNGADYGLYVIVETPDDRWLKRNYADPKGNFYDGKYLWFGGFNYTLLDFAIGLDDQFQLEEGQDVAHADITAISNALGAGFGTSEFMPLLDPLINWGQVHRELAAEQWVGHNDGYALNTNNYRVYFDPTDGKAQLIQWDFDYGFLNAADWGMSWQTPKGRLAAGCFQDAKCLADQKAAVQTLINAVDPAALLEWFNQLDALTLDEAQADPRRECPAANIIPERDYLRAWINNQSGQLASFWGL